MRSLYVVPLLAIMAVSQSAIGADSVYAQLDIGFVKASNTGPAYALDDPNADGDPQGSEKFAEYGYEVTPRIALGYNTAEFGTVEVSFWRYDAEADDSIDFAGNDGWASLETPWYSNFDGGAETASAKAELQANLLDVTWSNELTKKEKWGVDFLAGVRYAKMKNQLNVRYANSAPFEQTEELKSDGDGIGFRTGFRANASLFNGHLNLMFEATASLLRGSVKSSFVETDVTNGSVNLDLETERETTATIYEARLMANIPIWNGLSGNLGYEFSQWNGLAGYPRGNDGHGGAQNLQEDRSIGFDGFIIGLKYELVL